MQRFQTFLSKSSSVLVSWLLGLSAFLAAPHVVRGSSVPGNQQADQEATAAQFPANGLAQHPFLYCGEWQNRSIEDRRSIWFAVAR